MLRPSFAAGCLWRPRVEKLALNGGPLFYKQPLLPLVTTSFQPKYGPENQPLTLAKGRYSAY